MIPLLQKSFVIVQNVCYLEKEVSEVVGMKQFLWLNNQKCLPFKLSEIYLNLQIRVLNCTFQIS